MLNLLPQWEREVGEMKIVFFFIAGVRVFWGLFFLVCLVRGIKMNAFCLWGKANFVSAI